MPSLVGELKRNKARFRSLSIGPVGLEISLKDNQWSLAVEAVIGRQLDCFVVVGKKIEILYNHIWILLDLQTQSTPLVVELGATDFLVLPIVRLLRCWM